MNYEEHSPPGELKRFIECIWTLSGTTDVVVPPERVLPDGCMELIFHRGDPFRRVATGGASAIQPRSFVVGQMMEPVFLLPSNHVSVLAVRFHPGGAVPFFGMPLRELTGRFVSIDEVWGRSGKDIEREVEEAPSNMIAIQHLEAFPTRRLRSAKATTGRIRDLTALQVQCHGGISVNELSRQAGISERQLQREFRDAVGLSPKSLARILRFHRVFHAIEQEAKWVDIAFECGYYDQSHLIADFRQFTGATPTSFHLEQFELGRHFLRTRRLSGFSKTLA